MDYDVYMAEDHARTSQMIVFELHRIGSLLERLVELVSQEGRQIDKLSDAHLDLLAELEASANESSEPTVD